ncbi:TolB family protein [Micromonospora sp. NPDC005087]|uniref:TolB family protein n=1 Tax=Micromonospora sp. NPDC005087 TaxID=3364225 RepID=UPI0036C19349
MRCHRGGSPRTPSRVRVSAAQAAFSKVATEGVTAGSEDADDPTWSPDGKALAYPSGCEIWVQPIAGGAATNITNTPGECEIAPAWRPSAP